MPLIAFLIHAAVTLALVGLIWTIQWIHYPLFIWTDQREFQRFAAAHARRTGHLVLPLMLVELITGVWLAWRAPEPVGAMPFYAGLALLALIWLSTFLWQMPQHRTLSRDWDDRAHRRLVRSNWVRTLAWTARGALMLWLLSGLVA